MYSLNILFAPIDVLFKFYLFHYYHSFNKNGKFINCKLGSFILN